jgi:1-acyl-sn-glycerol-3-phosphate acyltransferase
MRTALVLLAILIATPPLGLLLIVAGLVGVKDGPGSVHDWVPRVWSRLMLRAAGVRLTLHGAEQLAAERPVVYVANHVSWFDVFTLAATLPFYKFVAKQELARIPIFGPAVRAAGTVFIDRDNRRAAFAGYDAAAQRIRDGASVVVYPEGTRGRSYAIRPFKKGPFVLAIAAGAPIVPTLIYGTMRVQAKGSFLVRPGSVHVHFLEPIPTAGMTYDDRDRLARLTSAALTRVLAREYGAASSEAPREPAADRQVAAV